MDEKTPRLYGDLAWLWPLWGDPDGEYAEWCAHVVAMIEKDMPALAAQEVRHRHEPILLIAHRSIRKLRAALRAIEDGSFAQGWLAEAAAGGGQLLARRAALAQHEVERTGARVRALFAAPRPT